ncbi:hypothetical protein L204_101876 [Cryptococcus depauperatus]
MTYLTEEQRERWHQDGYLILPDFFDPDETREMLDETRRLCDEFNIEGHPMTTFKTSADQQHVGDDYFLDSGDKIRYFLEPNSVVPATATSPAKLLVPQPNPSTRLAMRLQ